MKMNRRLFTLILAAACTLAPASSPTLSPCRADTVACASGPARGVWRLPAVSSGHGLAQGRLIDAASGGLAYRFRAVLTDEPTPCLSCIRGEVNGFLDDGSGGAPEFVVRGFYRGSMMSGSGRFELRVYRPNGTQPVGVISGTFEDAPGDGLPGRFAGDWQIC